MPHQEANESEIGVFAGEATQVEDTDQRLTARGPLCEGCLQHVHTQPLAVLQWVLTCEAQVLV